MRIEEIMDFSRVLEIVPHEIESRKKFETDSYIPLRDFLYIVNAVMNHGQLIIRKDYKIVFAYEEDILVGYAFILLTLSSLKSLSEVRFVRAWSDSDDVKKAIYEVGVQWARDNKIRKVKIEADPSPKFVEAMKKNYEMKEEAVILGRRL